jgi:hypothetical protein
METSPFTAAPDGGEVMTLRFGAAFSALVLLVVAATCPLFANGELPYIGSWSNGRGETLVITAKTLQFADDEPVPYRDITRATDAETFLLHITASGEVNAFAEKFLGVVITSDSMTVTGYPSQVAYMEDRDAGSVVTWFKDED